MVTLAWLHLVVEMRSSRLSPSSIRVNYYYYYYFFFFAGIFFHWVLTRWLVVLGAHVSSMSWRPRPTYLWLLEGKARGVPGTAI